MSLADRVVVMDRGQVCQAGPPAEVYDAPENLFVARFIGSPGMNFSEGEIGGEPAVFTSRCDPRAPAAFPVEGGQARGPSPWGSVPSSCAPTRPARLRPPWSSTSCSAAIATSTSTLRSAGSSCAWGVNPQKGRNTVPASPSESP